MVDAYLSDFSRWIRRRDGGEGAAAGVPLCQGHRHGQRQIAAIGILAEQWIAGMADQVLPEFHTFAPRSNPKLFTFEEPSSCVEQLLW